MVPSVFNLAVCSPADGSPGAGLAETQADRLADFALSGAEERKREVGGVKEGSDGVLPPASVFDGTTEEQAA